MSNWLGIRGKANRGKPSPVIGECSGLRAKYGKTYRTAILTILGISAALSVASGAENELLHGRVIFTEQPSAVNKAARAKASQSEEKDSTQRSTPADLVDKYGAAANSPAVANAIRKAEQERDPEKASTPSFALDDKSAMEIFNAIQGPRKRSRLSDPVSAISRSIVSGMPPEAAAMVYNSLPRMMRPEAKSITGEYPDPFDQALQSTGMTRAGIEASNNAQFERYMRDRFGPVYLPPLHVDHNWLAEHATKTAKGFIVNPNKGRLVAGSDHAGSVCAMTDQDGNVVAAYSYDPFGNRTRIAGSGPDADFGFKGMYYHARSGLYLTPFRAYSPSQGRWLSRDPLGEVMGTNLYAYCFNDPVNLSDPLGLKPFSYQYANEQQAVMAALAENNLQAQSHAAGKEAGFYTYKKKGTNCSEWAYSKPFISSGKQIRANEWISGKHGIPTDADISGFTHTHPDLAPPNFDPKRQQGYWTFSPEDASGADYVRKNAFLSNQYGQVRWLPVLSPTDMIISGPGTPSAQVVQRGH